MSIDPTFIDTAKIAFSAMLGWTAPVLTSNDKSLQLTSRRGKHQVAIVFTSDTVAASHDYLSRPYESRISIRSNWKKVIRNPSEWEIRDLVTEACGRYFLND